MGWKTAEKKKRSERSVRSSTGAVFEAGSEEHAASGTYLTSERFSEQLAPPTAACATGTPSRQKEPLERAVRKSREKEPWERAVGKVRYLRRRHAQPALAQEAAGEDAVGEEAHALGERERERESRWKEPLERSVRKSRRGGGRPRRLSRDPLEKTVREQGGHAGLAEQEQEQDISRVGTCARMQ